MNHTPGPWFMEYEPEGDCDAGDDGRSVSWHTGNAIFTGTIITEPDPVEGLHDMVAENVREADAALIAAAPDLLQACEDALESVRSGELYTVHLQEILSTAIAKARGEI